MVTARYIEPLGAEALAEVQAKHKLWIMAAPGGVQADLSGANLSWADLSWADLRGADLSRSNLRGSNLRWANLREANLTKVTWPERTIVLGPLGSRGDNLIYRIESDAVHAGCWHGTLDEFAARVNYLYPDRPHSQADYRVYPLGQYGNEYRKAIAYLRTLR